MSIHSNLFLLRFHFIDYHFIIEARKESSKDRKTPTYNAEEKQHISLSSVLQYWASLPLLVVEIFYVQRQDCLRHPADIQTLILKPAKWLDIPDGLQYDAEVPIQMNDMVPKPSAELDL